MEIKIQCDCGQRFKFDVEPVNGLMPFAVACPICGADGTQKGTDLIQLNLAPSPGSATPPAIAPPAARLRVNVALAHAPAPAPAPAASAEAVAEAGAANPPAFAPGRIGARPAADATADSEKPRVLSFGLGLLGGVGGALVGALLYYVIVKVTGIRLSYFAIGVGGLAGWMAELCGKGEGSKELASITAICTVGFIIAAQYFLVLGWWQTELGPDFGQPRYDRELKEAQQVVKMIPTGSDSEIRSYLIADLAKGDIKTDPSMVSDDDVKQFRTQELPMYQDFANGKITREQFNAQNGIDPEKDKNRADNAEGTFKAFFMLKLIRWGNVISLAAAAGIAFRLCANA